ncbi:hypothetical protein RHMOL_Rhmol04G0254700 [Rhododendron molle]|uniref:Uncharacterized protein n=1 Tax=Rhododendron molle TaxID=49168 RepID=A0ACC0P605_RHOML|nr:hypothetical protein RHMOL_Rhmol04G0254700 [Rhododendron molle]
MAVRDAEEFVNAVEKQQERMTWEGAGRTRNPELLLYGVDRVSTVRGSFGLESSFGFLTDVGSEINCGGRGSSSTG